MKKLFMLCTLASLGALACAADTTLLYCNVDNVPVKTDGLPAETGMTVGWTTSDYTAVDTPENLGFPKRVAGNANEKAIAFRDSSGWNMIYTTGVENNPDYDVADQRVSFYGYAKWDVVSTDETDFGVILRSPAGSVPGDGLTWTRKGYYCIFAGKNSSWSFTDAETAESGTLYPTDYTPFILRANASWNKIVAQNESSFLPSADAWHKYVAEVKGDNFRMSIDDLIVLEGADSTGNKYSQGYMMLTVYWDDESTDSNGKRSTMGVEEIKFEKIDNWASVNDWSLM